MTEDIADTGYTKADVDNWMESDNRVNEYLWLMDEMAKDSKRLRRAYIIETLIDFFVVCIAIPFSVIFGVVALFSMIW